MIATKKAEACDIIIVGSGAAGSVLAERLSADPRRRVLLIEQGPPGPRILVDMPRGYGRLLMDERYVRRYPVGGGDARGFWHRGALLGGSSSMNGTVWLRGQPADYDGFAAYGLEGWGWAEMRRCFAALEAHEGGESDLHGGAGPVPVRTPPGRSRIAQAFIEAGLTLGLPYHADANGPEGPGVGPIQHTIRNGRRVTGARGFLDKARRRSNLRIVTNTRVDRVLFEDGKAVGVQVLREGGPDAFYCNGEVILAAGALESPAILERSGVGDAARLKALGINPLVDSPGVGRGMQDHMILILQYRTREWRDSENRQFAGAALALNLFRHFVLRDGPLATGAHQVALSALSSPAEPRPDLRVMFGGFSRGTGSQMFDSLPGINLIGFLLRPESRGELHIASADPLAMPIIQPNYLATEGDRRRSLAMVRLMRAFASAQPVNELLAGETDETAWAQDDQEIADLLVQRGQSGSHASSTCMAGGPEAPLDSRLRVRGLDGVRVADLSILPAMISAHTQAPAMAIGWRAAELIAEDAPA